MTWINRLLIEFAFFFAPVFEAFEDEESLARYLELFGYELSPADLTDLKDKIDATIVGATITYSEIAKEESPKPTDILNFVKNSFAAYQSIAKSDALTLLIDDGEELFSEIFDSLALQFLAIRTPFSSVFLKSTGVIEGILVEATAPDGRHLDYVKIIFRWNRLSEIFKDTNAWAYDVYGWAGNPNEGDEKSFDYTKVITAFFNLIDASGLALTYQNELELDAAAAFLKNNVTEKLLETVLPLVQDELDSFNLNDEPVFTHEAGLKVVPFGNLDVPEKLGLALVPYLKGDASGEESISENLSLDVVMESQAAGGAYLTITPDGLGLTQGSAVDAAFRFNLTYANPDESLLNLLGDPHRTGLQAKQFTFSLQGNLNRELSIAIGLKGLKVVIDPGEDGFLSQLVSKPVEVNADSIQIAWRPGQGVHFDGGMGLGTTLPVRSRFGPFTVHTLSALLDFDDGASLFVMISGNIQLGPFTAVIKEIGMSLAATHSPAGDGLLGKYNIEFDFKPPSGIGLSLDASIIRGGGYLEFDKEKGEYFGVLDLKFATWGIKAVGLLTTKRPDGASGYSLLLLLYTDLPRFHIAFGIFFEGIGGVIGLHHGMDIQAIRDGMPDGLFDDILFPKNPVADAPRIINRLRVIFPISHGGLLVGPMFKLSWGTPAVGEIKVGILLAVDNALSSKQPVSLNNIVILGQVRIGLPDAANPEAAIIICDFVGCLDMVNSRFCLDARLRDSKIANELELTGSMIVRLDFGANPSFIVSVGGFHPDYKDLPSDLPAKIDRLGSRFNVGIVKVTIECYLAITSATIQFGADVHAKAKIGGVSIDGNIGYDALIYYEPYFRFVAGFDIGFSIRYKGRTLTSVDVKGTLSGPGQWHVTGRFKFSILWWDVSKSFDESWGDRPALDVPPTDVAKRVKEAFENPDNWSTGLVIGADTLVTLSTSPDETEILAHPMGQLRVSQRVAPLRLRLEKYGESAIQGPNRFHIPADGVTIGGQPVDYSEKTHEHFARSNFIELDEDSRLFGPSFEKFESGVAVGTPDFEIPTGNDAVVEAEQEYETKILNQPPPKRHDFLTTLTAVHDLVFAFDGFTLDTFAQMGAAASAKSRQHDRLRPAVDQTFILQKPPLTVVSKAALEKSPDVALTDNEESNVSLAEQRLFESLSSSQRYGVQLVEQFELE